MTWRQTGIQSGSRLVLKHWKSVLNDGSKNDSAWRLADKMDFEWFWILEIIFFYMTVQSYINILQNTRIGRSIKVLVLIWYTNQTPKINDHSRKRDKLSIENCHKSSLNAKLKSNQMVAGRNSITHDHGIDHNGIQNHTIIKSQ